MLLLVGASGAFPWPTIAGSIVVALVVALFLGAAGLVGTHGPLKNSNDILTKLAAEYKEAVAFEEKKNQDLLTALQLLQENLRKAQESVKLAEEKIQDMSATIANLVLENNKLKNRVGLLERTAAPAPARPRRPADKTP